MQKPITYTIDTNDITSNSMNKKDINKSIIDWWTHILSRGELLKNKNWNKNISVNKKELYNDYKTKCVGESLLTLHFLKNLKKLINIISEDHKIFTLSNLESSRKHHLNNDWLTLENAFRPNNEIPSN